MGRRVRLRHDEEGALVGVENQHGDERATRAPSTRSCGRSISSPPVEVIVFKKAFASASPTAVRDAIKEAEHELASNRAFREKLLDTANRGTRWLADNGGASKSAETRVLAKALEKMRP